MAWCHQAVSQYLSQCWPKSMSSYGVIRPQWVNSLWTHCGSVATCGDIIWANTGLGNDLLSDDTKPFPELVLTCLSPVDRQFHRKSSRYQSLICVWKYTVNITATSPRGQWVNSSPPSAAYMRQWIGSALVQIMACHLFGAKPLPQPVLAYCQLDSWEHISMKFESEFYHFHSRKYS